MMVKIDKTFFIFLYLTFIFLYLTFILHTNDIIFRKTPPLHQINDVKGENIFLLCIILSSNEFI